MAGAPVVRGPAEANPALITEPGPRHRLMRQGAVASPERMRPVGIKALNNRLSEYVRLAASGETIPVTDRLLLHRGSDNTATLARRDAVGIGVPFVACPSPPFTTDEKKAGAGEV